MQLVMPLKRASMCVCMYVSCVPTGAFVDSVDYEKRTPLLTALEDDDADIATLLLDNNADPSVPSQDFTSGLHLLATRWVQP